MKSPNAEGKPVGERKSAQEQSAACCGPGCGCGSTGKISKGRWVVGILVLAAAGVMVVRGMVKNDKGTTAGAPAGFADPAATGSAAGAESKAEAAAADETTVGTTLGAFAELNTAAAKTDAVFVYLPAKEGTPGKAPATPMRAAARTMEGKGIKCGLFTLQPGCADYNQIAKQMTVPGVLALVKGRGMSAVSGEVTESKLLQGYVAAGQAGGCGPGASAGCCPPK